MGSVLGAQNNMQEYFDRFAILLSGLCAIHCIALPIAASIIPLLTATVHHGNDIHEFWFHEFILMFILPISLIALVIGYRSHKKVLPLLVASLGLIILIFIALFAEQLLINNVIPHEGETLLTITGGIIHAAGHILNLQSTRKKHTACTT
ncbi:MAG: MerC domain-containing protein [Gammaproteobacteria bacterium]|nr:MerC domain-containing protein [Gammaproteobacteria bacterium]